MFVERECLYDLFPRMRVCPVPNFRAAENRTPATRPPAWCTAIILQPVFIGALFYVSNVLSHAQVLARASEIRVLRLL